MIDEINTILGKVEPYLLAVAVINLDNIAKNYAKIKKEVSADTQVIAVIKANAYGFGAEPVARRLYREGCRAFFVTTVEEGINARQVLLNDAQIFVLSGFLSGVEDLLCKYKLIPVLNNDYQTALWINHAKSLGQKLDAVVHIDTGMSRNGYSYRDAENCHKIVNDLNIVFIMSHLACADNLNSPLNKLQLDRFKNVMKIFHGIKGCFSATNGVFLGEDYFFDAVRPGKALYGFSVREDKIGSMSPVMDVFTRIIQISHLKPGDTIGYGATFTADYDMTVITAGLGYADGFMRKFSGFGHGFIGDKKINMVGRISMDYTVFDATNIDECHLKMGNWVALTNADYTLEKWALELNTLPHEIACRFGSRVKKVYIGDL